MSDVKKTGCCTLCDAEVYEIISYFPDGPLLGFPRKIGKALPNAYTVDYILTEGSIASLTCCESCRADMINEAFFPAIWAKVMRSFMFEEQPDVRASLPAPPRNVVEQDHILAELVKLSDNKPIGVMAVHRIADA